MTKQLILLDDKTLVIIAILQSTEDGFIEIDKDQKELNNIILVSKGYQITNYHFANIKVKAAELKKMLPFMLEDKTLLDIAQMHFDYVYNANQSVDVLLCQKQFYESILTNYAAYKNQIIQWLPFYLTLPHAENQWAIVVEHDQFHIRTDSNGGASLPVNIAKNYCESLLQAQAILPVKINIFYFNNAIIDSVIACFTKAEIEYEEKVINNLTDLYQTTDSNHFSPLNLIKRNSISKIKNNQQLKKWVYVAYVGTAILLMYWLAHVVLFLHFNKVNQQLQQEIAIATSGLNLSQLSDDPNFAIQIYQHRLANQENDQGFLVLMARVSPMIEKFNLSLAQIIYQNNEIILKLDNDHYDQNLLIKEFKQQKLQAIVNNNMLIIKKLP